MSIPQPDAPIFGIAIVVIAVGAVIGGVALFPRISLDPAYTCGDWETAESEVAEAASIHGENLPVAATANVDLKGVTHYVLKQMQRKFPDSRLNNSNIDKLLITPCTIFGPKMLLSDAADWSIRHGSKSPVHLHGS